MKYSWVIRQAFTTGCRHIRHHRWQILVMFFSMASGYTAVLLFSLHFLQMRDASILVSGLFTESTHAAAAWCSFATLTCFCLAIASHLAYQKRSMDMAIRTLHGGKRAVTVVFIAAESTLLILFSLFVGLVLAEWWIPVLTNWDGMEAHQRQSVLRSLVPGVVVLFALHEILSVLLPAWLMGHRVEAQKLLGKTGRDPDIIG